MFLPRMSADDVRPLLRTHEKIDRRRFPRTGSIAEHRSWSSTMIRDPAGAAAKYAIPARDRPVLLSGVTQDAAARHRTPCGVK
jgi:hypothetical protein